jgi:hypothetical protein
MLTLLRLPLFAGSRPRAAPLPLDPQTFSLLPFVESPSPHTQCVMQFRGDGHVLRYSLTISIWLASASAHVA